MLSSVCNGRYSCLPLDELKEDGIIDYNAKEIIILDRSRLKDMLLGTSKDDF